MTNAELLAEAIRLEARFAIHSPGSSRHLILIKDIARMRALGF